MRHIFFTAIVLFIGVSFSSCSKCYKCRQTVEIEVNGQVQQSESEEEFCTANQKEVKNKESNGSRCTPS
jgi:hypothetical protein